MRSLLFIPATMKKARERYGDRRRLPHPRPRRFDRARSQTKGTRTCPWLPCFSLARTIPPASLRTRQWLKSGLTEADLATVMLAPPDGILLPKSVNGASLQHLGALLAVKEAEHELADGATKIMAIVTETPAAIFNLGSYAGASHRLEGLTWAPRISPPRSAPRQIAAPMAPIHFPMCWREA